MNVAKITHKKIIDKKKNKVVDFGLLNTLKYIKYTQCQKTKEITEKSAKISIDEAMRIAL